MEGLSGKSLCGSSGTRLCFQGRFEGRFRLPFASSTPVLERDLNTSALTGALWLLQQACFPRFPHWGAVEGLAPFAWTGTCCQNTVATPTFVLS